MAAERPVEYLDLEDLVVLAAVMFGDPPPITDVGRLGAAVARPQTSVFGEEAYPDIWTKAAALLQSILMDRPLERGNRRLGWIAAAVFLELNGIPASQPGSDDVLRLIRAVARSSQSVDEIADQLRRLIRRGRASSAPAVPPPGNRRRR